ncbi:GUN4 domain-containing protein [Baaleninema simplex]|uniref:GUN4 domain-containing protein n=1 Tax=Baaleninema simplex TaxID=2862350 RepID=UPI00034829C8|nr:GUN4 domain-containing protein [Baaleninema simplex]
MSLVCPICQTPYEEGVACCDVCGWDVTPTSLEALRRQPTHLAWAKAMWERQRSPLETRLDLAGQERSHLAQQLDWLIQTVADVDFPKIDRTLSRLEDWLTPGDDGISLASDVGVDYRPLAALLERHRWKEADLWTWEIVLAIAQRDLEGWLRLEDIAAFPQTDIDTIDNLWYAYSEGRFGAIVQGQIWAESGENYSEFCDRVGWRMSGNWKRYEDLDNSLDTFVGHLPVLAWRKRACYGTGRCTASESLAAWISRVSEIDDGVRTVNSEQ